MENLSTNINSSFNKILNKSNNINKLFNDLNDIKNQKKTRKYQVEKYTEELENHKTKLKEKNQYFFNNSKKKIQEIQENTLNENELLKKINNKEKKNNKKIENLKENSIILQDKIENLNLELINKENYQPFQFQKVFLNYSNLLKTQIICESKKRLNFIEYYNKEICFLNLKNNNKKNSNFLFNFQKKNRNFK